MASVYDLEIEQGAVFRRTFVWKEDAVEKSLAGWELFSEARKKPGDADLILDLGMFMTIEPSGATGNIVLEIPGDVTEDVSTKGVWDLFIQPVGEPENAVRLLKGKLAIEPQVTETDPTP